MSRAVNPTKIEVIIVDAGGRFKQMGSLDKHDSFTSESNNEEKKEIKMTVPVTQEIKNGNMTMQFYLPSKFSKDNAPKPSNSEIQILTIEGGYYAVIKYSGRSSDQNFLKNKEILDKELKQDNITILSPPIRASYNSPFTLPMLKRNEVMYRVDL